VYKILQAAVDMNKIVFNNIMTKDTCEGKKKGKEYSFLAFYE